MITLDHEIITLIMLAVQAVLAVVYLKVVDRRVEREEMGDRVDKQL